MALLRTCSLCLLLIIMAGCSGGEPRPSKNDAERLHPVPPKPEAALILPVRAKIDAPDGQAPANAQRWEYKLLALQPLDIRKEGVAIDFEKQADNYTKHFNQLAQDGWEYQSNLASVNPRIPGIVPSDFAIFRRPKR